MEPRPKFTWNSTPSVKVTKKNWSLQFAPCVSPHALWNRDGSRNDVCRIQCRPEPTLNDVGEHGGCALTRYTTPITGAYYYVPSNEGLRQAQ